MSYEGRQLPRAQEPWYPWQKIMKYIEFLPTKDIMIR